MHVAVNMVGARRWCSVVLMLGSRRQCRHPLGGIRLAASAWRLVAAYPVTIIFNNDRLLYTALFFKSIFLRV